MEECVPSPHADKHKSRKMLKKIVFIFFSFLGFKPFSIFEF